MRFLVFIFVLCFAWNEPAHAQYGLVKHDGYKIPLGEAVNQIAPSEWRILFEDNNFRSYQVSWTKGKRWGEVLNDIGDLYDIAFVADARTKHLYCANSKELTARGYILVATDYEAEKYNLNSIITRAEIETQKMATMVAKVELSKKNLIDIEYDVSRQLINYEDEKKSLIAAESTALAMGMPSDKGFVSIDPDDYQVEPIKVIAIDPNAESKTINAGDFIESANDYFKRKWNYSVSLSDKSDDVKVSLPISVKLPSKTLEEDVRALSNAINTANAKVNVYFKVFPNRVTSTGQRSIEVRYKEKL
ncbi:hypothetical protein OCF84_20810 (plasmid) [Shewanella xiamenensis]|uniref:Uncharacterized protein n=1 Tax=Shewanella xiamenensis TaxID=332186 RepID=A0ABT6UHS0_9GAMM|nr:hypothetical protein [Shewanella xiamenensis]MDI5833290.1 hypothetical protein [Shewanella xiamenensis]WHF57960.1 hypothetical protein OCF84_20810 [Shewanella xiamenensis]